MNYETNPFPKGDADRYFMWEMLVRRDIDAFLSQDWDMVKNDFLENGFMGVNGNFLRNPDSWRVTFPTLNAYRDEWLRQAAETARSEYAEPLRDALFRATNLRDMDIQGDVAVLHKKFDGNVRRKDGTSERINWQTLYFCRRVGAEWKITGFIGYLPYPL